MPPKRKNRATKTASAAPLKTPPARNKVSEAARLGQVRRNSLAASAGRTSRLLPSVPFQMTTRRGAKTASAASSASSGSRRSSLNDLAQFQDAPSEIEDERPAKRSRTSTDSGSPQISNGSFDNNTPMNGTQTPELVSKPATAATLAAPPKAAGKRRRASDDSTQSSKTLSARPNGLLTRTQSDVSEQQPRSKRRKTTATDAPADSADQPPDLTDASTAPNSPEQLLDVNDSHSLQNAFPTNGDAPAKTGRRLPGRRRQPHSDINIETDLRRQLNLKMSYRSLAKVQKTLLEELSNRTIRHLEDDADYHKQCPAYKPVMAQLDQHRDSRLDQLNAARTYGLEQLERVRNAEKHIQHAQYINRFYELQDDFLLRCYFRMKQLEREMKGQEAEGTDDEDNILPPTYTDEPRPNVEDRLSAKFASRSRAYVEADRELQDDARRRRFDLARASFVEQNEEADDAIDELSGGFARFFGPDREQAIAHFNLNSMVDAAMEIERTPSPQPEPPKPQVISNAQALDLMMLADLSAQQPRSKGIQDQPNLHQHVQSALYQDTSPRGSVAQHEPIREASSTVIAGSEDLPVMPPQELQSSPAKTVPAVVQPVHEPIHTESNGSAMDSNPEPFKTTTPPRVSTHRIMDILNNDQDVPVFKSRDPQHTTTEQTAQDFPISQQSTPQHQQHSEVSSRPEPPPVDQALMDALGGRPSEPPSTPPPTTVAWVRPNAAPSRESEDALRRRDPLHKIRELLDRKAREHGRESTDRPHYGQTHPPSLYLPRISNAASAQDRQDTTGYDSQRPSTSLYPIASTAVNSSSSSAYLPPRRESQDYATSSWERERRMSGSQAPQQPAQSPYQNNPPQLHQVEHNRTAPTPPTHQSPYAPPPGSLPLPPKPPGPPPVNFRFAHYDPVPPRQSYPPPPQSPTYPPSSHPHMGPPPPQYASTYPSPYQGGYIAPPGSFQAPPPPSHPNLAPYPPLKIHQYGGQPILPANMAPPPHSGSTMAFVSQAVPPPAYSPPQAQPPQPLYESQQEPPRVPERRPEPQPRPRRQYRSYHAPGTQFRTYQGPSEGRRKGS